KNSRLRLQKCLHVSAFQRKPPEDFSGCIVESGGDRWSSKGVSRFRTSAITANLRIVDQHDFYFGSVRHFGNGIRVPVARSDSAFIEHSFFIERMTDPHHGAAFDLPF